MKNRVWFIAYLMAFAALFILSDPAQADKRIYVGNLPFSACDDEVRELFGEYGAVSSVNLLSDRKTDRPRGFCIVDMVKDKEADEAIEKLDGTQQFGSIISVSEQPLGDKKGNGVSATKPPIDTNLEGLEYETGDEFSVHLSESVPPEERGDYREFAEVPTDDDTVNGQVNDERIPDGSGSTTTGQPVDWGKVNEMDFPQAQEAMQELKDRMAQCADMFELFKTENGGKVKLSDKPFVSRCIDPIGYNLYYLVRRIRSLGGRAVSPKDILQARNLQEEGARVKEQVDEIGKQLK